MDAQQVIFAYILLGFWYLQDFIFRHWLAVILVIGISIVITIVVAARERGAKGGERLRLVSAFDPKQARNFNEF